MTAASVGIFSRSIEAEFLEALSRENRFLRADHARVDALPGDLAGEAAELDLRAAVHDHLQALCLGLGGGLVVADGELHPENLRQRGEPQRLVRDGSGGL